MPDNLGEIRVKVEQEGAEESAQQIEDSQEQMEGGQQEDEGLLSGLMPEGEGMEAPSGAGGGMMDGMMDMLLNPMTAILGGVLAIVGILGSMEIIQDMVDAFMSVIQAFFVPLAMMFFQLLEPVLQFLLKLLPSWYNFLQNPMEVAAAAAGLMWGGPAGAFVVQRIFKALKNFWKMIQPVFKRLVNLFKSLWNGLKPIGQGIKTILQTIWNGLKTAGQGIINVFKSLWNALKTLYNKTVARTPGVKRIEGKSKDKNVIEKTIKSVIREVRGQGGGDTNLRVALEGDVAKFIGMKEKNPNLP